MRTNQVWMCRSTGGCCGNVPLCLYVLVAYSVCIKLPVVLRKQPWVGGSVCYKPDLSFRRTKELHKENSRCVASSCIRSFWQQLLLRRKPAPLPLPDSPQGRWGAQPVGLLFSCQAWHTQKAATFFCENHCYECSVHRTDKCGAECLWT